MKTIVSWVLFAGMIIPAVAQQPAEQLIQADLAFSQLSLEKGLKFAFLQYADDQVIKLNNKQFAVRGKAELEKWFGDEAEDYKLEWKPLTAEIALSNDLGYTFGHWRMSVADGTFRYGEYMTVWKKQADGNWKFVLDGGNATPDNPNAWK